MVEVSPEAYICNDHDNIYVQEGWEVAVLGALQE